MVGWAELAKPNDRICWASRSFSPTYKLSGNCSPRRVRTLPGCLIRCFQIISTEATIPFRNEVLTHAGFIRACSSVLFQHKPLSVLRVLDVSEKQFTGRTGGRRWAGGSHLELFAADALAVGTEQVQEGTYHILRRGE